MSDIPFTHRLSLDAYPERRAPAVNWYDELVSTLVGILRSRLRRRQNEFANFYLQLKTDLASLQAMDETEYSEHKTQLRYAMVRDGLTEQHIHKSFALIYQTIIRELKLRPYKVQIMAGWVMMHGRLAEMETGEGKTIAALFPACCAAMAKIPVHIVTANDYLAERDANLMRPVYTALGLSVGVVTSRSTQDQRREAYACNVTYCTSKQLAMDYLRDRMKLGLQWRPLRQQLQQQVSNAAGPEYQPLLRGLCYAIIDEADSVLIDDARVPLILARDQGNQDELTHYFEALSLARLLERERDFQINPAESRLWLTESGEAHLAELLQALPQAWPVSTARPLILLALRALLLVEKDKHYLVKDHKIQLIDENTGRIMADRSWEHGLQQMVECKEGCAVTDEKTTLARISFQSFFRRYLFLAGMSGTASEAAGEFHRAYGLEVVRIPTRKPSRRKAMPERVLLYAAMKWPIGIKRILKLHNKNRPILIGTRTVKDSEYVGQLLSRAKLPYQILNARQDKDEAEVIAQAGQAGQITIATNMAGRGTDIKPTKEALKIGGLHVLAMELNDERRIDRQLYGRCGRQGNRGSCEAIASLDDAIFSFIPANIKKILRRHYRKRPALPLWLGKLLILLGQWLQLRAHARLRRNLIKWDKQQERTLAVSGRRE